MIRWLVRALAIIVIVAIALVVLDYGELLVWERSKGSVSMADTIPSCNGRVLAEGVTYKFRDPKPGEVVTIHAARSQGGRIVADKDARDLVLLLRVAAGPGDTIEGRDGTVFVNNVKFDDIATKPFPLVNVPNEQYFVLGDNRSAAVDSRTFGPILGNAIFARAFFVVWPLRDIGTLEPKSGEPPGPIACD